MLTSEEVADISRAVALEHGQALDVKTVAFNDGGSERTEILVTIGGCHAEPCRFLVSVPRTEPAEFEAQFRMKLGEAIARHQAGEA